MLKAIDKDIWTAEQSFRYFGIDIGTRMTIVRLADGELAVISPIKADNKTIGQINKLGVVAHIIAPNLYHYLFAADFHALYPDALFWAAPGLKAKAPHLTIDRTIDGESDKLWNGLEASPIEGFRTVSFDGFDALNECVFFHNKSRTLILTDAAFHFDESFPITTRLAARAIGSYQNLSPSLLEKFATTDKKKVAASIEKILRWDFERVIMAHGSIVEREGKKKLRQNYEKGTSINQYWLKQSLI